MALTQETINALRERGKIPDHISDARINEVYQNSLTGAATQLGIAVNGVKQAIAENLKPLSSIINRILK